MLLDTHGRHINYLRVSVTDLCNLRCSYCRPEEGIELKGHADILSLEEIYDIVKFFVARGINKVRLTGGEPLVRKNILFLIEQLAKLPGLLDLSLTTNGTRLPEMAQSIKDAGIKRINISLDTLNAEKYKTITRGGDIKDVFEGINAALQAGFSPIKINSVLIPGFNDDEQQALFDFCSKLGLHQRFIRKMDLHKGSRYTVDNSDVGKCNLCNRLRLTSDGKIKPCLFSDHEIDVRKLGIEEAVNQAMELKPIQGTRNTTRAMNRIGG